MNAALFIETRQLPRLDEVIQGHLDMLPDDYELIIYHGKLNKHLFKNFDCKKHEVVIDSLKGYNYFMTNPALWRSLEGYYRVLVFQSDSMLLRKGIEEFYGFDYIGAPWKFQDRGGNGGLSLRNPEAMLITTERTPYNPMLGYEDVYFSNHLVGDIAPRDVCRKFSVETIFQLGTLGCHAIENWLTEKEVFMIKTQYK